MSMSHTIFMTASIKPSLFSYELLNNHLDSSKLYYLLSLKFIIYEGITIQ